MLVPIHLVTFQTQPRLVIPSHSTGFISLILYFCRAKKRPKLFSCFVLANFRLHVIMLTISLRR